MTQVVTPSHELLCEPTDPEKDCVKAWICGVFNQVTLPITDRFSSLISLRVDGQPKVERIRR
jgi:hypothetical protein